MKEKSVNMAFIFWLRIKHLPIESHVADANLLGYYRSEFNISMAHFVVNFVFLNNFDRNSCNILTREWKNLKQC